MKLLPYRCCLALWGQTDLGPIWVAVVEANIAGQLEEGEGPVECESVLPRTRLASSLAQPRAAKRSRPMTQQSRSIGCEAPLTPAVVDAFMRSAIPVVPVLLTPALVGAPQTPVGRSRRAQSTPRSGGMLEYVFPAIQCSPLGPRDWLRQSTPSIEGTPLDLRPTDWDGHEVQEGPVVMLTEAQLQRFLLSYGRDVPRQGKPLSPCG